MNIIHASSSITDISKVQFLMNKLLGISLRLYVSLAFALMYVS